MSQSPLRFTHINETCLYVADLERTEAFYHGLLGLPVIGKREGDHVFFRAGHSVLLCFNPATSRLKTSPPPHYGSGNLHFAFEIEPDSYEAAKALLIVRGIEIEEEIDWRPGVRSFYFRDPDGHCVEIAQPGIWMDS